MCFSGWLVTLAQFLHRKLTGVTVIIQNIGHNILYFSVCAVVNIWQHQAQCDSNCLTANITAAEVTPSPTPPLMVIHWNVTFRKSDYQCVIQEKCQLTYTAVNFFYQWSKSKLRCESYPSADAASAGGDLEVSVQIFDGSAREEALHHQQDAVDEESRGDAVDHVLDDVDPGEWAENHWKHPRWHTVKLCSFNSWLSSGNVVFFSCLSDVDNTDLILLVMQHSVENVGCVVFWSMNVYAPSAIRQNQLQKKASYEKSNIVHA